MLKKPNPYIPALLPIASEAKWLLEYASKNGSEIVPVDIPRDLLFSCLTNGSDEEKIKSLAYLVKIPDYEVVYAIYKLINKCDQTLSEAAINALWQIQSSGTELPDIKVEQSN